MGVLHDAGFRTIDELSREYRKSRGTIDKMRLAHLREGIDWERFGRTIIVDSHAVRDWYGEPRDKLPSYPRRVNVDNTGRILGCIAASRDRLEDRYKRGLRADA